MRNSKFLFLLLILAFSTFNSQFSTAQNVFQKAIGGSQQDEAFAIIDAIDNGYIICGFTASYGAGGPDIFVLKTDTLGNIMWEKTYGGAGDDAATQIIATNDNSYMVTGYTKSFGTGGRDVFLLKLDISGNLIWAKTYGSSADDAGYGIYEADDGYLIGGPTTLKGNGLFESFIIHTDFNGNILWTKTFNEADNSLFNNFLKTSDGNYITSGYYSNSSSDYECKVMKFDLQGNIKWYKVYGGSGVDATRSIAYSNDGNYVICGSSNTFSNGTFDVLAYKIDDSGNLLWSKIYGGSKDDASFSIINVNNNGYLLEGSTTSFGFGSRDVYAVRIDNDGNLLWSKTYGGSGVDGEGAGAICKSVLARNNGFVISDYTQSFGAGNGDIYFLKTDLNGNTGNCQSFSPATTTKSVTLNVYAGNPTVSSVSLTTNIPNFTVSNINFNNVNLCCNLHVSLGKDTLMCQGNSIILKCILGGNDTTNLSYTWNDNSHNTTLTVNNPGIYSVTATDKNGCNSSDSVKISAFSLSSLNLGKDTTIYEGNIIVLNAGNGFTDYQWQDGSGNSTFFVNTKGKYWVTVIDKWGCKYSDTINVTEPCNGKDLTIPNCFTPNGDNLNDYFKPVGNCIEDFDMLIFNRWGGLIYETHDAEKGWNGKYKNKIVPDGVYVYIISYHIIGSNNSGKQTKHGTVTVLR